MSADGKDSHYRLSKKVAQLTKIIVQLNSSNEDLVAEKNQVGSAHAAEIKAIGEAAALVRREADAKIAALHEEIATSKENEVDALNRLSSAERDAEVRAEELSAKTAALHEEIATSKENEADALNRLSSAERDAKVRVDELQSNHEKERMDHAQTVRDLTQSLEEQSRQHQENALCLRRELEDENRRRSAAQRKEMDASHAEEIELLRSRHSKTLARHHLEAEEQTKSEVENAVAMAQIECEKKLSEQLATFNEERDSMRTEETEMNEVIKSLNDELERIRGQANEVPSLRTNLDSLQSKLEAKIATERKLRSEVTRLQTSLDSTSSSNQKIIDDLQESNAELRLTLQETEDARDHSLRRVQTLQSENDELKRLLDAVDTKKSSLESELKSLVEQNEAILIESEEKDSIIQRLRKQVDDLEAANANLTVRLSNMSEQLSDLTTYKTRCLESMPMIRGLAEDASRCRADVVELAALFDSSVKGFINHVARLNELHSDEVSKLRENETRQEGELDRLCSEVDEHQRLQAETKTTISSLEKKVTYLEETAKNNAVARAGERSSWEKSLEDLSKKHKRELAKVMCLAQDEQDILGTKITDLNNTLTQQAESHQRKCRFIESDWAHKMEGVNAAMSKVRYESALEIQRLSHKIDEMVDELTVKDGECNVLKQKIHSMQEQQDLVKVEHLGELESLSQKHCNEVKEQRDMHERVVANNESMIADKEQQIQLLREEMQNLSAVSRQKFVALECLVSTERLKMINELGNMKGHLDDLKAMCANQIDCINQEWKSLCGNVLSAKLQMMHGIYCGIVDSHRKEVESMQSEHSTAKETLNRQIAVTRKEAEDAKAILYNTLRENEAKLTRSLRNLKEEHDTQVKALVDEGQMRRKEYEALAVSNARKVDVIIQRDKCINDLKEKMSHTVKSFEEQLNCVQLQHENERSKVVAATNMQARMAIMIEKERKEKSDMQSEMQSKIDDVTNQLQEANDRWDTRESLPSDAELIMSLRNEIQTLSMTEKETHEKMMYFKRELENREESFTKRFVSGDAARGRQNGSPLRALQTDNAKPTKTKKKKGGSDGAATTKKVRGKVGGGAGARKKKSAASSQKKLPKIAK